MAERMRGPIMPDPLMMAEAFKRLGALDKAEVRLDTMG